jgi:hypothetical protein
MDPTGPPPNGGASGELRRVPSRPGGPSRGPHQATVLMAPTVGNW